MGDSEQHPCGRTAQRSVLRPAPGNARRTTAEKACTGRIATLECCDVFHYGPGRAWHNRVAPVRGLAVRPDPVTGSTHPPTGGVPRGGCRPPGIHDALYCVPPRKDSGSPLPSRIPGPHAAHAAGTTVSASSGLTSVARERQNVPGLPLRHPHARDAVHRKGDYAQGGRAARSRLMWKCAIRPELKEADYGTPIERS